MVYATVVSLVYAGKTGTTSLPYKWVLTTGGGIDGHLRTLLDGVQIGEPFTPIVQTQYDVLFSLTPGVHTVCMEIVETNNKICDTQTIGVEPVTCTSIAVDTWKPQTINPKSGTSLSFVLRSADANKPFRLYYEAGIPASTRVLVEGVTDSTGCYSGTINALPDGEYTIYMCYPFFGVCTFGSAQIIVYWGTKPMDIATMVLYAALGLGAAYIIGQVIAKDGG